MASWKRDSTPAFRNLHSLKQAIVGLAALQVILAELLAAGVILCENSSRNFQPLRFHQVVLLPRAFLQSDVIWSAQLRHVFRRCRECAPERSFPRNAKRQAFQR